MPTDIWSFMWGSPWLTFFLGCLIVSAFKAPFWCLNRYFRSRNIAAHGWPPEYLDADGDHVSKDDNED